MIKLVLIIDFKNNKKLLLLLKNLARFRKDLIFKNKKTFIQLKKMFIKMVLFPKFK